MKKIEYDEVLKKLYTSTKKEPFFVDVPAMNYLCFEGAGHPSDEDFQVACEALYTLSYLIKFEISRKALGIDYYEVKFLLQLEAVACEHNSRHYRPCRR